LKVVKREVNRQSNLKLNLFKQVKSGGPDISGLRANMSSRHWICPVNQDYEQRKSRSGTKTMNLQLDKLTTSKHDTIEHKEINRATRCNLFTRNDT
jgi:hypothetical protein